MKLIFQTDFVTIPNGTIYVDDFLFKEKLS